ncbi:MAG TPA: ATPase, partial [Saprospiraceae bacterium]|nr:ATPase [Saprospiraceae bacterium]
QQELDWVEDRGGNLYGYEFKWNARKAIQAPGGWKKNYPEAGFEVIHPGNYEAWLGYGNIV